MFHSVCVDNLNLKNEVREFLTEKWSLREIFTKIHTSFREILLKFHTQ